MVKLIFIGLLIFLTSNYLFVNVINGKTVQCGRASCNADPDGWKKCYVFKRCSSFNCVYTKKTCAPTDKCKTLIYESECDIKNGNQTCEYDYTDCDDNDPCTVDTCNPNTGCVHTSILDDKNKCTVDTCGPNGPIHTPLTCDDNNPCTVDTCNTYTGCVFTLNIDDKNPCTDDSCGPNGPIHTPKICNDNNPCNNGTCIQKSGRCSFKSIIDDNNNCTQDTCGPNGPLHTPISCDDKNPCTVDTCNPKTGCVHTSNLDDNDKCTVDSCGSNGPIHTKVSCPPKKLIGAIGLLCSLQMCDPSTGDCVSDPNGTPSLTC